MPEILTRIDSNRFLDNKTKSLLTKYHSLIDDVQFFIF